MVDAYPLHWPPGWPPVPEDVDDRRDQMAAPDEEAAMITPEQIEAGAKAICKSWPRDPNGCAVVCLDRLGSISKAGCAHAVFVHGPRARACLIAAIASQASRDTDR